jgi:DNA-directed RNA polymerase specialized sigma subunit
MDEKRRDVRRRVVEYMARASVDERERVILAINDPLARAVMRARYIDRLRLMEIADGVYYSEGHVKRLHKRGLAALGQILDTISNERRDANENT